MKKTFDVVHRDAVAGGEDHYLDPESGFRVFTEVGLRKRGNCCGSGCRHCPFQHEAVSPERRARSIQQPAWLTEPEPQLSTLVFWSGGKDSFLALRALKRTLPNERLGIISTFDAGTRVVAHQELDVDILIQQAKTLDLPLIGVPLHAEIDYMQSITGALALTPNLERVAFGDLHLEHIRQWRETAFSPLVQQRRIMLCFPLWRADYESLLDDLETSAAECVLSAVTLPGIENLMGARYNRALSRQLPEGIDAFGENGEFHTEIRPSGPLTSGRALRFRSD